MPKQQTTLHKSPGVCVRLSYYSPGERMLPHDHDVHQVSWLLAGEVFEDVRYRDCEILTAARGSKPADCLHANIYGRQGALLLSVNLDLEQTAKLLPIDQLDWSWSPADPAPAAALLGLIGEGGEVAEAAIIDLLALEQGEDVRETACPPAWLSRVREQLRDAPEAPDLESLAAEGGVHRVHLSRAFTRHFGLSPSLYRARSRMAFAVSRMAQGDRLAEAAAEAGFADQSHLNRWLKKETGLPPRRLQQLLAA